MSSSRATFVSGMTFGIAVGLVAGHFFIWHRVPTSPTDTELGAPAPYFATGDFEDFETVDVDPPAIVATPNPEPLSPIEASPSPLDHAIAISDEETVVTAQLPEVTESTPEPQPLAIDQAAPLESLSKRSEAEIRALIDLELPNAPQSQRDVWFDALRDLGEEDVAGVLRMWKLFGGPQTGGLSEVKPVTPAQPSLSSLNVNDEPAPAEIARENLNMLDVPGYKRRISIAGSATPRIDFQPGPHVITDYPLDIALEGPGFFKLKNEGGESLYTRNGQLCVLPDRTIGLRGQSSRLRFEPKMTVPKDAKGELNVSHDGEVSIGDEKLGTFSVVTFWNLDHLTPAAPGIFSATQAATEAPIQFQLRPGAYEGSNVVFEREQVTLKLNSSIH